MFSEYDFRAILAMDLSHTIGNGSALPWKHEPADMKRFKNLTEGHTVLMGRATWDSLPPQYRPLPNRKNIVLTRHVDNVKGMVGDNNHIITSIDALKEHVEPRSKVFLIGGGTMYDEFIKECSCVHLTVFHDEFKGDVSINSETVAYINKFLPIIRGSENMFTSEHGYIVEFVDLGGIKP